ncbi:hypothetical protein CLV79_12027 [Limimaricola soesokkakensis]|uniref:Uncharacterized protein n=1 Tax=Limimaricola soesokkakensis TaxID=1343159 RepID=A0A1X7A514_9RHOB|nr:hypothetical protein [Limimaricola soesokkakensis]PSK80685.1 hypothetical protein CLV79_12027 [Limimaricola soesokkakensis]SLN70865.1 hypothetical protein LOS8367_03582 [Limimaricola soesokkakensis]
MFDIPMPATALHRFAQEHYEPIQNAALLLGGRSWLRRVQRLLDHLQFTSTVTDHVRREAAALLELLTLEHVHDVLRLEAAYFADLDPADPHVEEICLLTDHLSDALDEWAAPQETTVVDDKGGKADV